MHHVPPVPTSMVRAEGWTLAHYPPGSEREPGGNTGEIKATRKGTVNVKVQIWFDLDKDPGFVILRIHNKQSIIYLFLKSKNEAAQ